MWRLLSSWYVRHIFSSLGIKIYPKGCDKNGLLYSNAINVFKAIFMSFLFKCLILRDQQLLSAQQIYLCEMKPRIQTCAHSICLEPHRVVSRMGTKISKKAQSTCCLGTLLDTAAHHCTEHLNVNLSIKLLPHPFPICLSIKPMHLTESFMERSFSLWYPLCSNSCSSIKPVLRCGNVIFWPLICVYVQAKQFNQCRAAVPLLYV